MSIFNLFSVSRSKNSDSACNVIFGRYTYGTANIHIHEWGERAHLKIGDFCSIASDVHIFLGGNHRTDWVTTFPFGHVYQDDFGAIKPAGHPQSNGDVIIGNDVWLGARSTIMSGITIGDGAVIAANSHVTKDVPAYSIAGGNPARIIRKRFDDEIIALLLKLSWWDLPLEQIKKIQPLLTSTPNRPLLETLLRDYRGNRY